MSNDRSDQRQDIGEFVTAYEAAWASREPQAMAAMWHADGVLHHPVLGRPIGGDLVPHNNDFTKSAIPELSWTLTRWAAAEEVVFLEWQCRGRIGEELLEWSGVDVMVVSDGKIDEERVYLDTYPLRRQLEPSLPDRPLVDPATLAPDR